MLVIWRWTRSRNVQADGDVPTPEDCMRHWSGDNIDASLRPSNEIASENPNSTPPNDGRFSETKKSDSFLMAVEICRRCALSPPPTVVKSSKLSLIN